MRTARTAFTLLALASVLVGCSTQVAGAGTAGTGTLGTGTLGTGALGTGAAAPTTAGAPKSGITPKRPRARSRCRFRLPGREYLLYYLANPGNESPSTVPESSPPEPRSRSGPSTGRPRPA